jgi:hypothetical protein
MKSDALRGLLTDARQPLEFVDQPCERLCEISH